MMSLFHWVFVCQGLCFCGGECGWGFVRVLQDLVGGHVRRQPVCELSWGHPAVVVAY
jgi:hypothetical protein